MAWQLSHLNFVKHGSIVLQTTTKIALEDTNTERKINMQAGINSALLLDWKRLITQIEGGIARNRNHTGDEKYNEVCLFKNNTNIHTHTLERNIVKSRLMTIILYVHKKHQTSTKVA